MCKIHQYLVALFITISLFSGVARAEVFDVVKDENKHIVKNTFNNCVRTKWIATSDACANAPQMPALTNVVEPQMPHKPIKRSRSYLVFFDFNKYNLTPSAVDIIKKANEEAHRNTSDVNFSVTGHADRAGSDEYNMKLSQRRANSVKNELVKLGDNKNDIETYAKGESEPLVPTKDGVKEPQNRRVEIIYSIDE